MIIKSLRLAQDFPSYTKDRYMQEEKKPQQGSRKKISKDLQARVRKHITDKNDVITDEDIKNIKVGDDTIPEDAEQAKKMADALNEKKITSPWTILSEEDK